jgi:16S rRNA (cytosine967-C5)-methyltransferase
MLLEPDLSLRVARGDVELVRAELAPEVELRASAHPRILLAPTGAARAVIASPAFARGDVTVQGESALRAAELVGAAPGERILDLCAAPGGKTAVLAASGARVVASDSSERRAQRLRETLARLVPAADVELRTGDGAAGIEPGSSDAVLVDVPCSNTGVLAARPGARWRFGQESQRSLGAIQERLLSEAAACVRPGGRLVYSTCSIEPEENQRRVRAFLAANPGWSLAREIESLPAGRGGAGPVDGGYAARLERSSS